MDVGRVGFIGLGNMGGPIAANIAKAGHDMIVYDKAGTKERAPDGATIAGTVGEVAAEADVVLLSLPDGAISASVAEEIIESNQRNLRSVADTSTIGVIAAKEIAARFGSVGINYFDAPVSGGTRGAANGTISVMFSGSTEAFQQLQPVLTAMSSNPFHVGTEPGQGQAMKIANNFLSALAMAATSEAMTFGMHHGLEMKTMIDVINASSGQNTATSDKFPTRILNESYDAGFLNNLLYKDVRLYLENVQAAGTPERIGAVNADIWRRFAEAEPGADFTRIYPFVRDGN